MRAITCVVVLCMHALSLNSKLLMTTRKKYFPCFIATKIDQSRTKRIYILVIEVNKLFFFLFAVVFSKRNRKHVLRVPIEL